MEPLLEVLRYEKASVYVRESAATALGSLGDERAVEPLLEVSRDEGEDMNVRNSAMTAVGAVGLDRRRASKRRRWRSIFWLM